MTIRPSSSVEIRQLMDALGRADHLKSETAVARLAVIGPRAVEHLLQEFPSVTGRARAGFLRAFEAAADPRTLPASRSALEDGSAAVQTAAIGAVRALLSSSRQETSRDALDALIAVALDTKRIAAVRLSAFDALRDAPANVSEPVREKLVTDADPDVSARAGAQPRETETAWRDATEGRLPASPTALKTTLISKRTTARLTELQHLVDHLRAQEQRESDALRREEWRAVRGAVHHALATRNSRLALYDLRDSLLDPDRLPVAFLAALEEIGDATCLEPLAAAYDASSRSGDTWWREHVATAFRTIVHREGLTRRHAAVKRTLARWPDAGADLMSRS